MSGEVMLESGAPAVVAGYEARAEVVQSFFETEADHLAHVCHAMARRFARGGRLLAFGVGAAATDAQHVSVEFVHPVIVGKRALPAIALINDGPSSLGLALASPASFLAHHVETLGRADDIALGMVHATDDSAAVPVGNALARAQEIGMLTIALGAPGSSISNNAEHAFEVSSADPFIVQEVHETLYHVLWELVHVFFDHKGLLEDRTPGPVHDTGKSSFLYPFFSESESDLDAVLAEVKGSILKKARDVIDMRAGSYDPTEFLQTATLVAERVRAGGKILAFGNGGSATDAQDFVVDLVAPPRGMRPIPAISLTNDAAVVTAVGNDVGFDNVFARQVIAYGDRNDIAVAISTSGGSRNVLAAVEESKRRGLLTVGLAGYDGGRLAQICDRVHTINADYIPRIQEAQASQYHTLRRLLAGLLP